MLFAVSCRDQREYSIRVRCDEVRWDENEEWSMESSRRAMDEW